MAGKSKVLATANFDRNLAALREFLLAADAPAAFDALLDDLSSRVIPALERFPLLGAEFMARAPLSDKGLVLFEEIARLVGSGSQLRQLIEGDYVVLYWLRGGTVYLLSIKHHRQLSFDLMAHWP